MVSRGEGVFSGGYGNEKRADVGELDRNDAPAPWQLKKCKWCARPTRQGPERWGGSCVLFPVTALCSQEVCDLEDSSFSKVSPNQAYTQFVLWSLAA